MLLEKNKSICKKHQKVIVSRDRGEKRKHIINNRSGQYMVRQYRLDGDIFVNELINDYLVLNDSGKVAYYIELKGSDVKKAVVQLIAGYEKCNNELIDYKSMFRIITSKSPTHNMRPKNYRDLLERFGSNNVVCKTNVFEENM